MKKILTVVCLTAILILSFSLYVSAESGTSPAVTSLKIESYPDRTVYGAFEQLDMTGLILSATLSDGSVKRVTKDEIQVNYNRDGCFRVGDETVSLSYGGKSLKLPVTVNRIAYDLSALELNSISTVYNGKFQSYTELLPKIIGLDGINLQMSAVGGSINAGVYDISIDFHTESEDYLTPESRVISLTIKPAEVNVVWDKLSFVYDGKSKSPSAYFTDLNGAKVKLSVIGAATNAGQGYTATASLSDSNYTLTNAQISFEIKKADYDMSGVKWSADSFTYDGSKRGVTLSGLPSGVSVIGYKGDRATDAGKYTASATLSWDEVNYNPPSTPTHSWEIMPADYDMSGVRFDSSRFVFDGKMHYPSIKGNMPVGADGIVLEYSFSSGACHVDDGVVSVIISFKTNSKNYNLPPNQYSSVQITPLGIEVEWGALNLIYNGEEQCPTAFSDRCKISVLGAKVGAGRYVAKAQTDNSDYFLINDSVEYTIDRATNFWTVAPGDSVCYEGREITLMGKSKFGQINYTFYSDPEGQNRITSPVALGKYYAVLSVSATENYDGLRSQVICFEIVPIVPVSFFAVISNENIRAFDRLTASDLVCSVINNDGSSTEVDSGLVKVIYENGDSFRKRDSSVTLKYEKFTLTLPVEIDYADYDLSDVEWRYTTVTYDGKAKSPHIHGLPEGVKVIEYVGAGVCEAGSYKIYARVEYDRENYNQPILPVCDFVINKCPISIPKITAVYNGKYLIPRSDSHLYTVTSSKAYVNAGKYNVTVSLTDAKNYVFKENSNSAANAVFEILPATIFVSVSDVELHLFEPLGNVYYSITGGSLFGDDRLTVSAYREGRRVLVRSENPNYILQVEPGSLIRLPYPTLEGGIIIVCVAVSLFLALLLITLIYRNRKRIATATAKAKCKWHNRGLVVPEPREMKGIRSVKDDEREKEILKKALEEPTEEEEKAIKFSENFRVLDFDVDAERADMLITDSLAKSLIKKGGEVIYTDGNSKGIINVDILSNNFTSGEHVDINSLKEKGLVDEQVSFIKVLARGRIDKPLMVYANEFSLSAVKMIALTGGQSIKVISKPKREINKST